jgi:hypothetical protein
LFCLALYFLNFCDFCHTYFIMLSLTVVILFLIPLPQILFSLSYLVSSSFSLFLLLIIT